MVLPFTNLSGDSSMNQLAEAVTEGLTDAFSSNPFLKVIASDTAKTYAGKPIDVKQIGKDLGVRYVLPGSLQPTETRVRVSAQLIDAESGVQLWAETFDEDRADPLQMEDEIVARVMSSVKLRIADAKAERLFQRGRRERTWICEASSSRTGEIRAKDRPKKATLRARSW
jgi:TolB-like protein